MNRNRCRPGHSACASHAGGSFSWHKAKVHGGKPLSRYAWPQHFKSGKRNKGQTVSRRMYASPTPTGTGGGTSTPNPKPGDGSSSGGGQGTKRA